jgi:hypothetical protein
MATWATVDDVKAALGLAPADAADDAWLAQVVAAANAWATGRRAVYGYADPDGAPTLALGGRWNQAVGDPTTTDPAAGTFLVDDPDAVTVAAFSTTDAAGNPTALDQVLAAGWQLVVMDDANPADVSRWAVTNVAAPAVGVRFDVGAVTDTPPRAPWPVLIGQWFAFEGVITDAPDVTQGVVYLATWAYRTRSTAGDRTASYVDFGGWSALPPDQVRLVNEWLGIPRVVVV